MVHYPTPGRHLRPIPSPNGAAPHAQGTFLPLSVTQRGITTRSGDISAPFRRLTAPRRTPGRHLHPIPSPSGAAAHARGTLLPRSVAQRCRAARPGNISAPFRRRGGRGKGNGRGGRSMGDGREAGPGAGPGAGKGKGTGTGTKKGAPDIMRRPGLPEARRRPTLPTGVSVPSARAGLTALFGMGRGGTPRLKPPRISLERSQRDNDN